MGKFGEKIERDYMKVFLFDDWYLCTSAHDFRVSRLIVNSVTGEETLKPIVYYTTLEALFDNLPNQILLHKGTATTLSELKGDITLIHSLIKDIKKQLKGTNENN